MSVYQNINGTLSRMDASDLVQLAAVDTEGILGGTPGATTDGQTLVDQLAADDVQAQTDIGQIKTDLSDYHVTPSKNLFDYAAYKNDYSSNLHTDFIPDSYGNVAKIRINGTASSGQGINFSFRNYPGALKLNAGSKYVFSIGTLPSNAKLDAGYTSPSTGSYVSVASTAANYVEITAPSESAGMPWTFALTFTDSISYTNVDVYPMLCTKAAYDADPTYVPYYPAMRDGMFPRSEQAILGAKNLLPYPYYTGSSTLNAVTYTVNSDGTVRVVANSTTVYSAMTLCHDLMSVLKPDVVYALNGAPVKPSSATYRQPELRIRKNSNNDVIRSDLGQGATFSITSAMANADTYRLDIAVFETSTFDFTFKPMIRLASDPDDTYVQFAMTNAELTYTHKTYYGTTDANSNLASNIAFNAKRFGLYAVLDNNAGTGYVLQRPYSSNLTAFWVYNGANASITANKGVTIHYFEYN